MWVGLVYHSMKATCLNRDKSGRGGADCLDFALLSDVALVCVQSKSSSGGGGTGGVVSSDHASPRPSANPATSSLDKTTPRGNSTSKSECCYDDTKVGYLATCKSWWDFICLFHCW